MKVSTRKILDSTVSRIKDNPVSKKVSSALSRVTVANIYRFFGLLLIVISVSFYLTWSILFDTWADVGLYDFTVVLLVLGFLTVVLVEEKERQKKLKSH
ncbi:MAG: hypothetical protein M1162_05845 [Candidatus Thermoplasmatota archaeon]|nr:hypothetical protein [Candidatus Thermoplasmatota archaeon]